MLQAHFLRERRCELVIARPFAAAPGPDMNGEPLFREQLRIVVSNRSERARKRRRPSLADLVDAPWILSPNEVGLHSPIVEAFQAIGAAPPTARALTGSLNLRRTLLRTGRFVTVMPHSLLRFGPDQEWIKVLSIDLPDRPADLDCTDDADHAAEPDTEPRCRAVRRARTRAGQSARRGLIAVIAVGGADALYRRLRGVGWVVVSVPEIRATRVEFRPADCDPTRSFDLP
ncbi:hypothetical protein HT746_30545 [Burkholderia pyrrocinia]|uniref:LysR substrate-binding domain-containing protein n=1 Tax=Burkholderia pyrrocinia TaxID=60550 RepID=UPI00157555FF|nr:hypothetical protein [Burkholderia pyrrocinia]